MRRHRRIKARVALGLALAMVSSCLAYMPGTIAITTTNAKLESITPGSVADAVYHLDVEDGVTSTQASAEESTRDRRVNGRVTTGAGAPIIGKTVVLEKQVLYHEDEETLEKWVDYDDAVTDANGNYQVAVASNTVYRLKIGGVIPVHSDPIWVTDKDVALDLTADLYTFDGTMVTESGDPVPNMYITIRRMGDVDTVIDNATLVDASFSSGTMSDAKDGTLATLQTGADGSFCFDEIASGNYLVLTGRTGVLTATVLLDKDQNKKLTITEDNAVIEDYRTEILGDDELVEDYDTELDVPGELQPTPTPSPTPKPSPEDPITPNTNGKRLFKGKTIYTPYMYTISQYARMQHNAVPAISAKKYISYLEPGKDTTKSMKYLRIDTYRPVCEKKFKALYNSQISTYCRAAGIPLKKSALYGKASVLLKAAKKYKIDPIFLTVQTFYESAYGTSRLASGNRITQVAKPGYPRDSRGKFITKKIKKSVKVYNLYGIKACDTDPYVGGTSFAYYSGWTTPTKAILGAAEYISNNYIHGSYKQNTPYEIRYTHQRSIWHQYASGPNYADELAKFMIRMSNVYNKGATFTYDYPKFKEEKKKTDNSDKNDGAQQDSDNGFGAE